jgi:hypothetical protein
VGSHPLNLLLRFPLEIATLVAVGYSGFGQHTGIWRFLLSIGFPVITAVRWATFAVPGDPTRSSRAPVPIPGVLRMVLELSASGFTLWMLYDADSLLLGLILESITVSHYALWYNLVAWPLSLVGSERHLTRQPPPQWLSALPEGVGSDA